MGPNLPNKISVQPATLLGTQPELTAIECIKLPCVCRDEHPVLIAMECTEPLAGNGAVVTSHTRLVHTGCFHVDLATVRNFLRMAGKNVAVV